MTKIGSSVLWALITSITVYMMVCFVTWDIGIITKSDGVRLLVLLGAIVGFGVKEMVNVKIK